MSTCSEFEKITESPEETIALGRVIGGGLNGGEVIALTGQLGSGKTHLIKGIAAGAGAADRQSVNSPTFVLINEYAGEDSGLCIYHIDAYRLESAAEFEMLGFDDMCRPDSVVVIEWADRVAAVLADIETIDIELSHIDQNSRKVIIKNAPDSILKN
jgi:tRNA threonylcarbamoyladenosine biosynthesis protein TsaE